MHTIGSKYEATKGMTRAQIAALFRKDVKAAIAAGDLPATLKLSVRTNEYSTGGSISVNITSVPFEFMDTKVDIVPTYTAEAKALVDKLKAMLNAYNFDDSDIMSDYFHKRFSSFFHFGRV